jgi:DNA-binding MarR family transcriptional regulator
MEMIREGLDVTPRQSWIMMAVEEKPHNQATIAEILEVNANQMVREVDQLERKRLIRRIRNPENRRDVLLQVTPKGKRLLSKMYAGLEARDARIVHPISMVEVRHLTALVRAIIADYHAKRP